MKKFSGFVLLITSITSKSQIVSDSGKNNWSNHFQATVIFQTHPSFNSPYSGRNSLSGLKEKGATSITTTLFMGRKLWKNAAFYFNPEVSGGRGLSFAVGVAGALNGETYRIGNPKPAGFIARSYLQQYFPIGKHDYENVEDAANQVAGKIPNSRITISAGKFAMSDFYDDNKYSKDPRTQFFNWSLWANGAWDYPANTRGYTFGIVTEIIKPKWVIRLSTVAVPRIANAPKMEYNITKAHSETFEIETKTVIRKHPGAIRFLITNTHSKAPSYAEGLKALATGNQFILDVISGDTENITYSGKKFGLGLNAEQEVTKEMGMFTRIGWNDGRYASWAFTEIDRTIHLGLSVKGTGWKRADDVFAIAGVINAISHAHRNFLKAGGYGFIIGDGKLNYSNEAIIETYYSARFSKFFWLTLDYEFVNHPGYNKDRGPTHVFGIRGHIEL